jgi:hypothetical protein
MNENEFKKLMEIGEALGYPPMNDASKKLQFEVWNDEGRTFEDIKGALENEENIKNIPNVDAEIARKKTIIIARLVKELFGMDAQVVNGETGETEYSTFKSDATSKGEKIPPIFHDKKTPEAPINVDWDAELKRIIN